MQKKKKRIKKKYGEFKMKKSDNNKTNKTLKMYIGWLYNKHSIEGQNN